MLLLVLLTAVAGAPQRAQGADDDDTRVDSSGATPKGSTLSAAKVAKAEEKAEEEQPKGCKKPTCPQQAPSPLCGYLQSDEKDAAGCLRYPCGVLSCEEDEGAHKQVDPGNEPTITILGANPQRISTEQAMFFDDDGAPRSLPAGARPCVAASAAADDSKALTHGR